MRVLHCLFLFVLLSSAPPVTAAKKEPPPKVPPAEELNRNALNRGSRAALALSVKYFRELAAKDDEGWMLPPIRQRQVTGYKDYVLKYSKKIVDVPIYEYEYYWVMERVGGGSAEDAKMLKKVRKSRIKRQKGTKKEERLVRDPKGPISRTHKRPVYGEGGPDFWPRAYIGHNALILYALRKAGVPADDPMIYRLSENLSNFVLAFGGPDTTWDLAWTTAAFSLMPSKDHQEMAQSLAGKLLDGQVVDKPARGLWGPVSVNTELLAESFNYEQELVADWQKAKAKAKERQTKSSARKARDTQKALRDFQKDMKRLAMLGMSFDQMCSVATLTSMWQPSIQIVGLPSYIYNQTAADINSTGHAIYALRQAAAQGVLPAETYRPLRLTKVPILAPQNASGILARSANALAEAQADDGGWSELNSHQPVRSFEGQLGIKGLPVDVDSFGPLVSATTVLSDLQGFSSMINAGHIVGARKLLGRFRAPVLSAQAKARKRAASLVDDNLKPAEIGGLFPPYDCLPYLVDVSRRVGTDGEDARDLWARLACKLVMSQSPSGTWDSYRGKTHFMSTSVKARAAAYGNQKIDPHKGHIPHMYTMKGRGPLERYFLIRRETTPALSTALAMIFLAEGARPPIAGACQWTEDAGRSQVMPLFAPVLKKKFGISTTYMMVDKSLPVQALLPLPALLINGTGRFSIAGQARDSLQYYLKQGGLVLIEIPATIPGRDFRDSAQAELTALLGGGGVKDVSNDDGLIGDMAGKVKLTALARSDGTPAAIFLPIAQTRQPQPGVLAIPQAAQVIFNILLRRIEAEVLDESYLTSTEDGADPKQVIDQAIYELNYSEPPPTAKPPEPAAKPADDNPFAEPVQDDPGEKAPAVPTKKAPAADETWD